MNRTEIRTNRRNCHPERSEGSIGTTAREYHSGFFASLRMTGFMNFLLIRVHP